MQADLKSIILIKITSSNSPWIGIQRLQSQKTHIHHSPAPSLLQNPKPEERGYLVPATQPSLRVMPPGSQPAPKPHLRPQTSPEQHADLTPAFWGGFAEDVKLCWAITRCNKS